MSRETPQITDDVFAAIAHPKRRQILDHLSAGDATVKALASQFEGVSRPAVSQHLAILLEAGLVTRRQDGRESFYHLQTERLQEVEAWLRQYQRFWTRKLDALGGYLDRKHGDETKSDI
jgi:DNA-binding transcriptional ArsR family regulator